MLLLPHGERSCDPGTDVSVRTQRASAHRLAAVGI